MNIKLFSYAEKKEKEKLFTTLKGIKKELNLDQTNWIRIIGKINETSLAEIKKEFGLQEELIEDILETDFFSQMEEYEAQLFFQFKFLNMLSAEEKIKEIQISFLLSKNLLITIEDEEIMCFGQTEKKIKNPSAKIRKKGADSLFLSLIDQITENYYLLAESLAKKVETIENHLLDNKKKIHIQEIVKLKNKYLSVQDYIFYLRDALNKLVKENSPLLKKISNPLSDALDQSSYLIDYYVSYRNRVATLIELYMANISNQMNKIMQTLTIFSSIFLPMTFITSLYGMNFKYMPELEWEHGYYMVWAIIILMGIVMIFYTKKKNWW